MTTKIRLVVVGCVSALASILLLLVSAALAETTTVKQEIQCVQNQLNDLGYDAGAVDGELSLLTRKAARAYINAMQAADPSWSMPMISTALARFWCKKVAEAHEEIAHYWDEVQSQGPAEIAPSESPVQMIAEGDDQQQEIRCVQAALTAQGYDVGGIDGVLGTGTKGALALYLNERSMGQIPVDVHPMSIWCLLLAAGNPIDHETDEFVADLSANAIVTLNMVIKPPAPFDIFFIAADNQRFRPNLGSSGLRDGEDAIAVTVPFNEVMTAKQFCVVVGEGWIVRDSDGKAFQATCTTFIAALWTNGGTYTLKLEKGRPDSP